MKVVYIDSWTRGIHNFLTFDALLKAKGAETLLLHFTSWQNKNFTETRIIENIQCVDVSYFKTIFLEKILQELKPDVVVSLNTTHFFDRILRLTCGKLNIKTVFLMHGDHFVHASEIKKLHKETSKTKRFKKNLLGLKNKFLKYSTKLIPNYLRSLFNTQNKRLFLGNWLRVLYVYWRNYEQACFNPPQTDELIQDLCLIFSERYKNYYHELGYPLTKIKIVGNPSHVHLLRQIENNNFSIETFPELLKTWIQNKQSYALYLDDAFVEQNSFPWLNTEYRNKFFNALADAVEKQNINLVIKLHPATDPKTIKICRSSVCVLSDAALNDLIYYADFCLGFISTTLNSVVLLKKPLLIPVWEKYNVFQENNKFLREEVAKTWNILEKIPVLADIHSEKLKKYIAKNITVTKPTAIESISKEILNLFMNSQ